MSRLGIAQSQDQSSQPSAPPASTPQAPERLHIASGVTAGLLIKRVNPTYPTKAREQRMQGVVVMRAIIDKRGEITDLQLVSGDPMLAKAAIKAVKKWKYRPYLLNGEPVSIDTQIQVNFTLSGG